MMKKEHLFDNGVKVFDYQLLPIQRERYKKRNVHEEDEKDFLIHDIAVSTNFGEVTFANESYGSSITTASSKVSTVNSVKNIIKKIVGKTPYTPTIIVQSIPMINLFALLKTNTIDFVQRHEHPVLQQYFSDLNSGETVIKSFLIGTHGIAIHNACKQLLESNGYKIVVDEFETKNQPDGIIFCRKD
jgi:hypothetical protein